MNTTIGTCSLCGGRVSAPTVWFGIYPPVPECESCGATKREHGPVVEMEPRRPVTTRHTGRLRYVYSDGAMMGVSEDAEDFADHSRLPHHIRFYPRDY